MSTVDDLPPDQRAALTVLLRQRKSYAQVADMLGIPEHAVHDRAHAALAVLAPREARALDQAVRAEIGDYVLGQQPGVAERLRTRTLLGSSPAATAWAQALAAKLDPLAPGALPDVPAPGQGQGQQGPAAPVAPQPAGTPGAAGPSAPQPPAQGPVPLSQAAQAPSGPPPERPASSRLGGAILLTVIVILAVVAIVIFNSKGSSSPGTTGKSASTSKTTSTSTTTTGPKTEARFTLHPPDPHSRSTGTVEILSEDGKRAFYIQAEHIPASKGFFYAVWLYNSHTSALPLSKAPAVGSTHKLAGAALLPEDAGDYKEILLTRETSTRPTHPGHVVLRGAFKLP